jgi:hypothetical protein
MVVYDLEKRAQLKSVTLTQAGATGINMISDTYFILNYSKELHYYDFSLDKISRSHVAILFDETIMEFSGLYYVNPKAGDDFLVALGSGMDKPTNS